MDRSDTPRVMLTTFCVFDSDHCPSPQFPPPALRSHLLGQSFTQMDQRTEVDLAQRETGARPKPEISGHSRAQARASQASATSW